MIDRRGQIWIRHEHVDLVINSFHLDALLSAGHDVVDLAEGTTILENQDSPWETWPSYQRVL